MISALLKRPESAWRPSSFKFFTMNFMSAWPKDLKRRVGELKPINLRAFRSTMPQVGMVLASAILVNRGST